MVDCPSQARPEPLALPLWLAHGTIRNKMAVASACHGNSSCRPKQLQLKLSKDTETHVQPGKKFDMATSADLSQGDELERLNS